MNRYVLMVAAACSFVDVQGWAQSSPVIQPTVLIEAKRGAGPGEFAGRPGEIADTMGPVVDDQENIYILAPLNDCLQHYDSNGKYLGCISIPSSSQPTADLRKAGHEGINSNIMSLDVINGSIYAYQLFPRNVRHLLRMQGNAFVSADDDKDATNLVKRLSIGNPRDRQLKVALAKFGGAEGNFSAKYPLEKKKRLCGIYWDKNNNLWALTSKAVRVYSPAGELIHANSPQARPVWGSYVFSKRGNLYILDKYDDGIRLLKYSLQGK